MLQTIGAGQLKVVYTVTLRILLGTLYLGAATVRVTSPQYKRSPPQIGVSLAGSLLKKLIPPTWGPFLQAIVAKRILIADDHELILRGVRALLRAHPGWEICGEAADGREAIAKATELRPDLVVLDYAMPCLDGLSAAKEIHQLLPTVPIVLHTLYGTTEIEQAANKYGIRRVVAKANSGALISAVEELLSTSAASQPDAISDGTSEERASG